MPTLSQAEAADVGEAEAEGEEEAIHVKKISVIIVKIMDTGNVIAERNNVTRDIIEDSSKEEEEKLKELPPELWSEGPADYIQTASFGLRLRFKDGVLLSLTIRRCTTLNPATLLPTAEEGHQHNCLDEVSTKVLPRPDLNSTPQEPIQPGDYVWVKKFVRKREAAQRSATAKLHQKQQYDKQVVFHPYEVLRDLAPSYLEELVSPYHPNRPLCSQNAGLLVVPRVSKGRMGGRAFSYQAPLLWNQLPVQRNQMGNEVSLVKRQHLLGLDPRPSRPTLKLQEEVPSPACLACPQISTMAYFQML
ncbi:hypothetical protein D4764_04G0012720 [Takifugu flavidus]|uniref:Uncharacterized protein n=1 Tax=Takifugu flavidus TaxID=433684 RepID=A0A5C6N6C1_9TELE|nr:hypothetical protein D4764_04G0012720 [Takifugu flavidus]